MPVSEGTRATCSSLVKPTLWVLKLGAHSFASGLIDDSARPQPSSTTVVGRVSWPMTVLARRDARGYAASH